MVGIVVHWANGGSQVVLYDAPAPGNRSSWVNDKDHPMRGYFRTNYYEGVSTLKLDNRAIRISVASDAQMAAERNRREAARAAEARKREAERQEQKQQTQTSATTTQQQSQTAATPQQAMTAQQRLDQGKEFYNNKNYDRAITEFTEAIKLAPNKSNYYAWRGYTYYEKKDYDRSIADYTEAIRLEPNDASYYYSRGNAYYSKKDWNRAIADYEATLRINPNHANAKDMRERIRREQGR